MSLNCGRWWVPGLLLAPADRLRLCVAPQVSLRESVWARPAELGERSLAGQRLALEEDRRKADPSVDCIGMPVPFSDQSRT